MAIKIQKKNKRHIFQSVNKFILKCLTLQKLHLKYEIKKENSRFQLKDPVQI